MSRGATHIPSPGRWAAALACTAVTMLAACSDAVPRPGNHPSGLGSTALCADSYLLALAPERIRALSWQAGSPLSTAPPDMTNLPRLWASREVLARTDLSLLGGPGETGFNHPTHLALQWGEDFDAIRQNIDRISAAFGIDPSSVLAEFDSLSDLPQPERAPRILYLSRSGGSAGPGTYVDAVIRAAGGLNINEQPGWHTPSLEQILSYEPDLILTSFFGSDYAGVNDRMVRHSALRRYLDNRPRFDMPGKLWPCAGPGLVEATKRLNQAVRAL